MATRLRRHLLLRPFSATALLIAIVAAIVIVAASAVSAARLATFTARSRALASEPSPRASTQAVMHFRFRGRTRFVRIAVDPVELATAHALDTSRVFSSVGPVREAYVRQLVEAMSRSGTVAQIADQLRRMRAELGLDDDGYVELIARFVQEIPYGTVDDEVRLPAEVATRGSGVCDDKSVLLASLLLHEGYDTVVWAFDSQAHAAVGVRCLGPGMRGSGYAYVETTAPAYVGQINGSYGGYARWRRPPQMIQVGGSKRYQADLESEFVARIADRAGWSARQLRPYWERLRAAPPRWRNAYQEATVEQASAQQLTALLRLNRDDRGLAFALLTSSGGR